MTEVEVTRRRAVASHTVWQGSGDQVNAAWWTVSVNGVVVGRMSAGRAGRAGTRSWVATDAGREMGVTWATVWGGRASRWADVRERVARAVRRHREAA